MLCWIYSRLWCYVQFITVWRITLCFFLFILNEFTEFIHFLRRVFDFDLLYSGSTPGRLGGPCVVWPSGQRVVSATCIRPSGASWWPMRPRHPDVQIFKGSWIGFGPNSYQRFSCYDWKSGSPYAMALVPHLFGTPNLQVAGKFTGVIHLTSVVDHSATSGFRVPSQEPFLIFQNLPLGRCTIYDANVAGMDELIYLTFDEDTKVIYAGNQRSLSPRLLELCAGFGGMGIGASFAGAEPWVSVDWNGLACSHLNRNHHGKVLQLDLQNLDSARIIHTEFDGSPGTATMGFPCQPHSTQGAGLGQHDPRHQTFWGGLRVMFLCQCQTMILECVPAAGLNHDVQQGLHLLATALDLDIQTTELDLASQWPCSRRRWWAVLLPRTWKSPDLVSWPGTSAFDSVQTVIKCWNAWSTAEEHELQLHDFELAAYTNNEFGKDARILLPSSVAACFLHSYGKALTACPCGCRSAGFTEVTLKKGGLRGAFVASAVTGAPRFLHPKEVGILLGVPCSVQYGDSLRGSLSLLGLISSPIQMIWVYGHLRRCEALAAGQQIPNPMEWLDCYRTELLRQSISTFGAVVDKVQSHITLKTPDGDTLHVVSAHAFTVSQLLKAERINLSWNEAGGVTLNGARLSLRTLMDCASGPYTLEISPGLLERPLPVGLVMIAIVHNSDFHVAMLQPGQFLFEALRELNIDCNFLVDDTGKIFGADFRIWRSLRLFTLDNAFWPPITHRLFGNGVVQSCLGLHDGHIWFVLTQVFKEQGLDPALLIHPRLAFGLLANHWTEEDLLVLDFDSRLHGSICCIFEFRGHWSLLWGKSYGEEVLWTYSDGIPGINADAAGMLAGKLTSLLGFAAWDITSSHGILQNAQHTCGTIAIMHALQLAGLFGTPSDAQIADLHNWLLRLPLVGIVHGGGLSPMLQDKLKQLLIQHGVPPHAADDRQLQVIQKLGPAAIHESFAAKNPWAYLKALCSKPSINLRLVHADELTKHVAATAVSKFGAGVQNHKQKKKNDKKGPSAAPSLDPSMLLLTQNGFKDPEDDVVPQITFDEVTAGAHGIAISNFHQSYQILQTAKSISTYPLGILLVEPPPAEFMTQFNISSVTFTATYKGTGEPVLIFGAFKSLGDHAITQHIPGNANKPELIDTQVIKVQVFRDEFEGPWAALVASPVKVLCQTVPLLTLCHGKNCGAECPKSHAAIDEQLDTILMEVWSRTFTKIDGGRVAAQDATLFWVFFRVPLSILQSLLQIQAPGIYFEPRDGQTKAHDDSYRVIWLPSKSRDQALHVAKTCMQSLGLVRMRMKYGIRVAADDEEAAFKAIKPDSTFVATQVQRVFQLFPLPHGLQRAGVSKLLEGLEWTVKPLQPGKGNASAMSWTVGSESAPPRSVITGFGQEILITEITKENKPAPPPRFIASQKTQKHLRTDKTPTMAASSSEDPWLKGPDPWNAWQGYTPVQPAPGKSHLKELQGQLRDELQANLQKEVAGLKDQVTTTADADTTKRLHQMETTIGEIQAQGHQFQTWFHTMGQQIQANEAVVQTMQSTLNLHQQELHGIKQEVGSIPAQVSQSIQGALQSQRAETDANMEERFNRLETLLTGKLQRREWLSWRGNSGPTWGFLTPLFRAFTWLQFWVIIVFGFLPTSSAWSQPFAVHFVPSTAPPGDRDLPSGALGSKNTFLAQVSLGHFQSTYRIGEAAHPGPLEGITLGCTNPGGLRLKESLAVGLGQGLWTYSETQLSSYTQRSSAKAIRALARENSRVIRPFFGAPAPLRSRSTWAGSWTGVACLSDFPGKKLEIEWPPDLWASGRVLATQHFIGSSVLTVVSLYGLPRGPTWPAAASMMADILEFLSKTFVFGHSGLVAIQGDYNFGPHELDHFRLWKSMGWTDAQSLAMDRWGYEWQPTCKGSTERDMIWMSPALAALCMDFQIRDVFADHSVVSVRLAIADEKVQYWTWPRPGPIPWDQVDVASWHQHCENLQFDEVDDSTCYLAKLGQSFETSLNGFVKDGSSLPAAQCGRAQTLKPRVFEETPHTAKASRQGELRLTSDLVGHAVQQWFKQARRLQSYVHAVRANKMSPNAVAYRLEVWSSVLNAKGFDKPFSSWWSDQEHALALGPLPQAPPLAEQAEAIFHAFQESFRKFERWHLNQKNALISHKYDRSFKAIFAELRDSRPDQIDCLWSSEEFRVVAIRPGSCLALLDKDIPTKPDSIWFCKGCQMPFCNQIEEMIAFTHWPDLQVGDILVQHSHTRTDADVHEALISLWKPRWQNTENLADSDWIRIVNFVEAFMPTFDFVLEDIQPEEWLCTVRRLKDRAAVGVDGFSKFDMLNMSPFHLMLLLKLFHDIEAGRRAWPRQWLESLVLGLAKTPEAHTAGSFRPIVLFSALYRVWGSLRCRQILRQLEVVAHSDALGFLPGRETLQAWVQIQGAVETSLQNGLPIAGLATDMIKAFNSIQRPQWFLLARKVGLPDRLLRPWRSFLGSFTRRFQVHNHLSRPLDSKVGFAEGDPISVAAMALLDWSLHVYMDFQAPRVRTLSFVDNVSMISNNLGSLLQSFFSLLAFQQLWGLSTDVNKSYAWSTSPSWRTALKPLGLKVVEDASELGGSLALCASTRVRIFLARGQTLDRKWQRLRVSKAPLCQKLFMLPMVFWAAALHGALGTVFADTHIHDLRKQAVAFLRIRIGGSNPILRLGLSKPMTADPGFYQLRTCVFDFRRACWKTPDLLCLWKFYMTKFIGVKTLGPFYKIVSLFSMIGWTIEEVPFFRDHDGCRHHLLNLANSELDNLLLDAWLQWMANQVLHRKTMADLVGLDTALTFLDREQMTTSDLNKTMALQTGAFLTPKQQSRFDASKTGDCPLCGVADTQRHWFDCPRFGALRTSLSGLPDALDDLPQCVLHHLLPPRNPFVFPLKHYFVSLPDKTSVFLSEPQDGIQHLFTDGSCFQSAIPCSSTAGWAVVNATSGEVTGHGWLPGLLQTSARAELSAIIAALRWGLHFQVRIALWCDSLFVVNGVRNLLSGKWVQVTPAAENHDLWQFIAILLEEAAGLVEDILWVPSHLALERCDSSLEEWICSWNDVADACAVSSNEHRSHEFQTICSAARAHHELWAVRLRALRHFYLQVSEVTSQVTGPIDLTHDVPSEDLAEQIGGISFSEALPLNWKQQLTQHFESSERQLDFCVQILDHLFHLESTANELFQLSFIELAFWLVQDRGLPVLIGDDVQGWELRAYSCVLLKPTVASIVQSIRKTMKEVLTLFGLTQFLQPAVARLEAGISMSTDGIIVHSCFSQVSRCAELTRTFAGPRQLRKAADLAKPMWPKTCT